MSASLAILTIGIVPMQEVLPLLTEYIDEDNISHHSLLGKLSREEVMAEYAPEAGEDTILTLLNDNHLAHVSRRKVERDLQGVVEVLDNQGYDVIILMSTANISSMTARNTIFLEPSRILPPLVSSIVEDHQVGVIVPVDDAPRDKCTLSCAINGIHAAFHYLKKNYISGCVMTVPTG